jgi:hypothetical protein
VIRNNLKTLSKADYITLLATREVPVVLFDLEPFLTIPEAKMYNYLWKDIF